MINRRFLEELLQQPLGPYHDRDILHEKTCQMKGGTQLVLYSFILEHDGHVIGLDESERPLNGKDDRRFRFRGVLKIADPNWLSDFGLKTVEAELNLRADERAMQEGGRRPPHLTLEGLFHHHHKLLTRSRDATWKKEDEMRLTVLIQGERNMPAAFMQSSPVQNGLLWNSKAHERNFQIATMDVATYSLSQNFFWQWRLFALMETISKEYPYVPPTKRTPIWFVEKYMARYACPQEDKHRRLISDEKDPDMDETGKTVTPRHLLRPHTSEILGIFAAHADWLITHNEVKRRQLFDIASWKGFANQVRKERKEALRQGVRWGWPAGQGEEEEESSEEDTRESNRKLASKWATENPVIGKSNRALTRKIELRLARKNRDKKPNVSSDSESEVDAPPADYASDFSEPSDAEENDSDHQQAEEEAVDLIPWQLQQPPQLPDVDGRWWCPLPGCDFQIDLHGLTEDEVPESGYIMQKQWRNAAYDRQVVSGFGRMVGNHYLKHFADYGVKMERRPDGKLRCVFMNGRPENRGGHEPIRGPMPARGTLGGESRVVPIVHAPDIQ